MRMKQSHHTGLGSISLAAVTMLDTPSASTRSDVMLSVYLPQDSSDLGLFGTVLAKRSTTACRCCLQSWRSWNCWQQLVSPHLAVRLPPEDRANRDRDLRHPPPQLFPLQAALVSDVRSALDDQDLPVRLLPGGQSLGLQFLRGLLHTPRGGNHRPVLAQQLQGADLRACLAIWLLRQAPNRQERTC